MKNSTNKYEIYDDSIERLSQVESKFNSCNDVQKRKYYKNVATALMWGYLQNDELCTEEFNIFVNNSKFLSSVLRSLDKQSSSQLSNRAMISMKIDSIYKQLHQLTQLLNSI